MTNKKVTKASKKKVSAARQRLIDVENAILALDKRTTALEGRDNVVAKAFRTGANEIRSLFGLGSIAVMFDRIADRIEK